MTDEVTEVVPQSVEPEGSPVSESVEVTETPILSVEEYSTYRVPVKLDGEELQVPLSEALAGYQRQADYTRKTQELAQQREQFEFASALQTALERDPSATLDLLANHYGISRQAAADMVAEDDFESLDPTEKRYRELDQRLASFEDYQSKQQVEAEVKKLQARYEDFNINEVVTAALRTGSTDLEGTYKQIAFDKLMAKQELERAALQRQQAAETAIVESKRAASVVSGGASATASTTNDSFEPITSIAEAWAAAKRTLNS